MMVQRTNLVLPTGVPRACRLRFRICFAALAAATMAFHVGNAGGQLPPSDTSPVLAARVAGYVPGELLVKPGSGPARLQTANSPHNLVGATVLRSFPAIGWEHVRLPEGMSVGRGIKAYLALPGVLAAEPNYKLELDTVPNDPRFASQWGLILKVIAVYIKTADLRCCAMNARLQEIQAPGPGVEPPGLEARLTSQTRLEGRWRGAFENSAIGISLADLGGRILSTNAALQEMLGYSQEELQSLTFFEVTHEEDRGANRALVTELIEGRRQQFRIEKRYRRKDGPIVWAKVNVSMVPGDANSPRCLMAICEEITERKWAEALLAGEKRVLGMIAGGGALGSILDVLCRVVEEMSCGSLCSILLLDEKGERLWSAAAPSLPKGYAEQFNGRETASCWGPCATAALRKEQVIAGDILADPLWERYRPLVLCHGLQACWSTPIFSSEGKVLGTFAILSREPRSPAAKDQKLMERFTHLASIAIERARGEEALLRSEAYLAEAQRLSRTGSFGWNVATGELVWSAETFCILGYERSIKPTLDLVLKRVHSEELGLVQRMIDSASRDGAVLDFEHRLLMADGSFKHVHVLAHSVRDESGKVEYVGAVSDVTAHHLAQQSLEREKRLLEMIARGDALAPNNPQQFPS